MGIHLSSQRGLPQNRRLFLSIFPVHRYLSMLDTSQEILSPRSSIDEPRRGEEDVEIDWVLAYDFDDIGTELRDLGLWQMRRLPMLRMSC